MPSFVIERRVDLPLQTLWEVLTDHRGYAVWGPVGRATLERPGTPDENGLGAIRRLVNGPLVIREEVVLYEPPHRFAYAILSGPPVRDHLATVSLSRDAGLTLVRWSVRYEGRGPLVGLLLKPVFIVVIRTLLAKAVAEARRRSARPAAAG